MVTIQCLEQTISSGGLSYPIFMGFLSAEEILRIAEAPSFGKSTGNRQIAANVLTPPIHDWQRPLNEDRVEAIAALFNDGGEIMPNPVLLCENAVSGGRTIAVEQQKATGSIPTDIWKVVIDTSGEANDRPLWILDGQHRINGLARSAQSSNPIPVVLLLNRGSSFYNGPLLAKIFAQVTTSATKLDSLHNEWLTYAFQLEDYSAESRDSRAHQDSMECVARLCMMPTLPSQSQQTNPFMDRIQFNNFRPNVPPVPGGFDYDCTELKKLVFRHYYHSSAQAPHIAPADLAAELCRAHIALTQTVKAPQQESVFFGSEGFGQKIMQDAFFAGVMAYLLRHGRPESWADILRSLAFDRTNWNFKTWVRTLSGREQTTSRNIAIDVFTTVFRDNSLPQNTSSIADYMRGDTANVTFAASYTSDDTGRVQRANKSETHIMVGSTRTWDVAPRNHIKVIERSKNVGKLEFTDKQSPPGRIIRYHMIGQGGLFLSEKHHNSPIQLLITMHHYGGNTSEANLDISWKNST